MNLSTNATHSKMDQQPVSSKVPTKSQGDGQQSSQHNERNPHNEVPKGISGDKTPTVFSPKTSKHALVKNATSSNTSHHDHVQSTRPRTKSRKFVVEVKDDGEVLKVVELKRGRDKHWRPKRRNGKASSKSRGRSTHRSMSRHRSSDETAAKSDGRARRIQAESESNATRDRSPLSKPEVHTLYEARDSESRSSLRVSNTSVSVPGENGAASKTDAPKRVRNAPDGVQTNLSNGRVRNASETSFSDVIASMDQIGSIDQLGSLSRSMVCHQSLPSRQQSRGDLGTLSSSMVSHRSLPSRQQQSRGRQAITRPISANDLPGFSRARSLSRSHTSAANNSSSSASISKGIATSLPRCGRQAPRHARSLSRARFYSEDEALPRSTQKSVVSQGLASLASTLTCMATGYQENGPDLANLAEEGEDPLMNSTITIFEDDDEQSLVSDPTCLMEEVGEASADDCNPANLPADKEDPLMNSAITIFEEEDDSSVLSDFTRLMGKGSPPPRSTASRSDDNQDNKLKQKKRPNIRTRMPSIRARGKREARPLGKSDITKETAGTDESIIESMESEPKKKSSVEGSGRRFKSRMSWF